MDPNKLMAYHIQLHSLDSRGKSENPIRMFQMLIHLQTSFSRFSLNVGFNFLASACGCIKENELLFADSKEVQRSDVRGALSRWLHSPFLLTKASLLKFLVRFFKWPIKQHRKWCKCTSHREKILSRKLSSALLPTHNSGHRGFFCFTRDRALLQGDINIYLPSKQNDQELT